MYFPPHFDLRLSIELARLIMQAYQQLEAFERGTSWTLTGGYTLIKELCQEQSAGIIHSQYYSEIRKLRLRPSKGKGHPIGFVAVKGRNTFVVFRGTVTIPEWVRTLNVRLSAYPESGFGKVHDGFLETYTAIRRDVMEAIMQLGRRSTLFVAGHSLGGALATLALPDISINTRFKDPKIYTFGSPRVGDRTFSESFNGMFADTSFRLANTSDVVVSLPLPVPILGVIGGYFNHVKTPVDFAIQEEDLEKNHVIETYLSALLSSGNEMVKHIFRWRPVTKNEPREARQ